MVSFMQIPQPFCILLETERMILRTFANEDLEDLLALHTDAEVMRYLGGGVRTSREAVQKDLASYIAHQQQHGFGKWAILHKDSGEFMGRAGFVLVPETQEIDLGYAFHKKYWQQGYGSEIASGLVQYGLKRWNKDQLIGLISSGNNASARILEKAGFAYSENKQYFGAPFKVYRLQ